MRKKLFISLCAATALSFALPVASYADEWRHDAVGWQCRQLKSIYFKKTT